MSTWRHKKRGTQYELVGLAMLQTSNTGGLNDNHPMVVYRDQAGTLWVRPEDEFFDGRFEEISQR
jgi:hypothetical protein